MQKQLQRRTPDGSGKLALTHLPSAVADRAAQGATWVSLIAAATSVALLSCNYLLQPEFAAAWRLPHVRLAALGLVLFSLGFAAIQRNGWLRQTQRLNLGLAYQVITAFVIGLLESATYSYPDAVVRGRSGIGVWMLLCGFLMPNAPLKSAAAAALCVAAWPLSYWTTIEILGYPAMPPSRMAAWILPLCIAGAWTCVLSYRMIAMYTKQESAERLGSYTLDSRLGRGGMGEVWRAKHCWLARAAAIKLIRPDVIQGCNGRQGETLQRRFEREAQSTASLRSPHTVALYDFGQTREGAFYYVMELLEGIDLQTLVVRFGPLEPGRAVHILLQICESLEEAHRMGLVHRDIKPRNVLVCKLGLQYDFAKVLDFGLVKVLRPEAMPSPITGTGVATGTPAYMPPEVAMGRPIDGRADLYSLGCVAYFLLTGQLVFEESSRAAYVMAHERKTPAPMRERSEMPVPAELEALVMQLLEKDPACRVQSAAELAGKLRRLVGVSPWSSEDAAKWWETNQVLSSAAIQQEAQPSPAGRGAIATTVTL